MCSLPLLRSRALQPVLALAVLRYANPTSYSPPRVPSRSNGVFGECGFSRPSCRWFSSLCSGLKESLVFGFSEYLIRIFSSAHFDPPYFRSLCLLAASPLMSHSLVSAMLFFTSVASLRHILDFSLFHPLALGATFSVLCSIVFRHVAVVVLFCCVSRVPGRLPWCSLCTFKGYSFAYSVCTGKSVCASTSSGAFWNWWVALLALGSV